MNVRLITISGIVLAVHVLVIGAFWLGVRRGESKRPPAEREGYALIDEPTGSTGGETRTEYVAPQTGRETQQTTRREPLPTNPQAGNATAGTTAAATPRYHVVASGESFWKIAKTYGVSVDRLMTANNYAKTDTLQVGVKLVIPES
jgi:LysM repeat protein